MAVDKSRKEKAEAFLREYLALCKEHRFRIESYEDVWVEDYPKWAEELYDDIEINYKDEARG